MKRAFVICGVLFLVLPCTTHAVDCPIPDTGQTKCYDNTQEIICPSAGADFYGQDAQYEINTHSYTKLDENGNDLPDDAPWPWVMVRDNVTGLIWEAKTDDGSIHDKDNSYDWYDAQDVFIAALNDDNFGGYSEWRMPNIKELSCIVDSNISLPGPTINTYYFPNTLMGNSYGSSTTHASDPSRVWVVDFRIANVFYDFKSFNHYYVRAVRGGQSTNNFIDNGDGTVTDTDTSLMWQKDTAPSLYFWQQALSYCENLSLAGHNDWRLPNRNELQSLVDYSRAYPSIDPVFPDTVPYYYWSSTTLADYPYSARLVIFGYGDVRGYFKSDYFGNYVRAVRGGQCGLFGDSDGDTVCDNVDNCIDDYNPFQIDCDNDGIGDICDLDTIDPDGDGIDVACDNCLDTPNPNQLDSYPPQGNGIGDVCDCEGNFNCSVDQDVDGSDAALFKADFGRSTFNRLCNASDPCNGDFSCNGNVDGTDAALFKSDFGRSSIQNPCPMCVSGGEWCQYP